LELAVRVTGLPEQTVAEVGEAMLIAAAATVTVDELLGLPQAVLAVTV
jgi:hypothetical protein